MSNEKETVEVSIPEKGQFDFWYNAKEEMMKGIKKPFRKSALKRGFASAYDNWSEQIISLQEKVIDTRKELITCKDLAEEGAEYLNSIIKMRLTIKQLKEQMEELKEERVILFDEEMKVDIED